MIGLEGFGNYSNFKRGPSTLKRDTKKAEVGFVMTMKVMTKVSNIKLIGFVCFRKREKEHTKKNINFDLGNLLFCTFFFFKGRI